MDIRIQVMHAGDVCVAPGLPFGGEKAGLLATSGLFVKQDDRLWLPVSAYLIDHPDGFVLVDTGWDRSMSPRGSFDKQAQLDSLGSKLLYRVNQGAVDLGKTVVEQLADRGLSPEDLSCVLLTHLDCDHANGLRSVKDAQRILVSADELASVSKNRKARIRYQSRWWEGVDLQTFEWTGAEGPFGKSYDLFGDGRVVCIAIPGHSDGLFAVKVTGDDGRFVLLCSDGAYAERSWKEMILPGVANNREQQRASLEWIRKQSEDPLCVEVLANHDPNVEPHTIELLSPIVPEPVEPAAPAITYDEDSEGISQAAGKVAVATMLAATLSAAPISYDDFQLPVATPIVQVVDLHPDLAPDNPDTSDQTDTKSSIWEKIFKILKYALLVLAFLASFALTAVNGCTSCVGPLAAPVSSGASSESSPVSQPAESGQAATQPAISDASQPTASDNALAPAASNDASQLAATDSASASVTPSQASELAKRDDASQPGAQIESDQEPQT